MELPHEKRTFDESYRTDSYLKILFLAPPFLEVPPDTYGGIERVVAGLVRQIRSLKHTVGMIAHPDSTCIVDFFSGWKCIRPTTMYQHLQNIATLRAAMREFQPDLVHNFARILYLTPLLATRVPKIMSYGAPVGHWPVRLASLVSPQSLRFTGCSEWLASAGRKHGGQWDAIPNFVDIDAYHYSSQVPKDAPLVFLSRIDSIKGPDVAIDIAKRSGKQLIIAGNAASSGPEKRFWDEVIAPKVDGKQIVWIGPVNDVQKNCLLGNALALVVPIQWDEPFGIVFVEALACGTPVITCPRGAALEIISHGSEGYHIRSVEDGMRAVASLHKISRQQCRCRAESLFSLEKVAKKYETLYISHTNTISSSTSPPVAN